MNDAMIDRIGQAGQKFIPSDFQQIWAASTFTRNDLLLCQAHNRHYIE
jgi:hypothetical protein